MSYQRLFIEAVSDILLAGDWLPDRMTKRVYWLLEDEPSWVETMVGKIYERFQADLPYIDKHELADFILNSSQFIELWRSQRLHLRIRQFNIKPAPPPPAKFVCQTPTLDNLNQLAVWLGLTIGQLEHYARHWSISNITESARTRHYHYYWKQRKGGQQRLIEAPKKRMAAVQRQIYHGILDHIPLHQACHGFRKKHSCLSYAEPHAGKNVVIRMDLKDFFLSIPVRRIHALFTALGYRESVARRLAGICCNQTPLDICRNDPQLTWFQRKQLTAPHLPQGSPSSPILANLCTYKLDVRLAALAEKLGGVYTRYADDLAFSGNDGFIGNAYRLPVLVAYIAGTEGFSVNHRKTRIMRHGVSQRLTGMTLNRFPNIPRKDYDRLKAILHNCVKTGPKAQNRRHLPHFKAHLKGQIAYVRSLNPRKAEKLELLFRQIDWENN